MTEQKTPRRRRHDASITYCEKLDSVLSAERKAWIYDKCKSEIAYHLCQKGASVVDANEIASSMYYDLVDRRCEDVFPRGIPQFDGEWFKFLKKEMSFAFMAYFRSSWRHPTDSLDAPIGNDGADYNGDGEETTLCDLLTDASKDAYRSRPEVSVELRYVRDAVSTICARRGYKESTCHVVNSAFIEDNDVADVAVESGLKANNVSAIKFRFLDALCEDGASVMAELEW